ATAHYSDVKNQWHGRASAMEVADEGEEMIGNCRTTDDGMNRQKTFLVVIFLGVVFVQFVYDKKYERISLHKKTSTWGLGTPLFSSQCYHYIIFMYSIGLTIVSLHL
ncbi:hypothetical protein ACJX0J_027409, partial [Zea mays]